MKRSFMFVILLGISFYVGCLVYIVTAARTEPLVPRLPVPPPGSYCPAYPCYGPCGAGCVCVTPPGEFQGTCWGVDFVPKGWKVHGSE